MQQLVAQLSVSGSEAVTEAVQAADHSIGAAMEVQSRSCARLAQLLPPALSTNSSAAGRTAACSCLHAGACALAAL
jgi:hypothetical protein